MTITITAEDAVNLLKRVVEERGEDFSYKPFPNTNGPVTCFYERDGQPSCGVGLALFYAGLTAEQLAVLDAQGDDTGIDEYRTLEILSDELDVTLEPKAVGVFSRFQVSQDREEPYGAILQRLLNDL